MTDEEQTHTFTPIRATWTTFPTSGMRMVGEQAPLFAALAKARAAFEPVLKTKKNPFFNSMYADLSDVLDACMPALTANGLYLCQLPTCADPNGSWTVYTLLTHSSGAFWELQMTIQRAEWQKFGSALTYARRYVDSALLGVASEPDDDGSEADAKGRDTRQTPPQPPTKARTQPVATPVPPKVAVSAPAEPSSAGGANVPQAVELPDKGSVFRAEDKQVIDMPSPPPLAEQAAPAQVKPEPAGSSGTTNGLMTDDQRKEITALLHSKAWPDSAGKPFREKNPKTGVERWAIVNTKRAQELVVKCCKPGVTLDALSAWSDAASLLNTLRDLPEMPVAS